MSGHYDIEADWYLLDTCNFRCEYCFFSEATLGQKLTTRAEPAEWRSAFDTTGLTWLLHLTGGEPSLYPRFTDFAAALTERHYISFNTNLTGPELQAFAKRIDPTRVSFINAGLHFAERRRRSAEPTFLRHLEIFRDRGFPIFVSAVATPTVLAHSGEIIALLRPLGVVPAPKLLNGLYRGRHYPKAYTVSERHYFRAWARLARNAYDSTQLTTSERPTINPFSDDRFLKGTLSYAGRICSAGSKFVSIEKDGDVYRCSKKLRLGNVLDGTLSLLTEPKPCDTAHCYYFCEKYAEPSQRNDIPLRLSRWSSSVNGLWLNKRQAPNAPI